jgi:hypothetical protein
VAWVHPAVVRQLAARDGLAPLPVAGAGAGHAAVAPLDAEPQALQREAPVWAEAQRAARDAAERLQVVLDAAGRLQVVLDAAGRLQVVLDAEALRLEGRGAPALPSVLPSALAFRRGQALLWLVPQPAARFAHAMACLRVASP